ncbi:MAG: glycoside hydrolase family 3 C-terminal domain-containing protein [Bacteroidales bacterium]|nr:glycoside hydrolase family 3 C-terminal domain-containing protein [Bacteroidales bacterium]
MKIQFLAASMLLICSQSLTAQQLTLSADNVDEVLKAMTLEEKATLCVGYSIAQATEQLNGVLGAHADLVPGAAGATRAIPRLGIPSTVLADGPAGVRIRPTREGDPNTYYATGFPVGTALACTWNQELVESVGHSIGNEVLEYGCDVLLAPGMNIHRSPLCGRNFEYYSEDPLVAGKIAAAYVRGIQSQGVGTSIKHFAVNSQETNRTFVDEVLSQRALREIYLKGFEIAVKEADPWTVMSSYNQVNGEFAQQSHGLLTTILRDEWGFKGIVMTDWGAKEGTVKAVIAGNDLMEPGNQTEINRIIEGVNNGTIPMADLDRNARRMLQYIVRTPRFKGYKYSNKPDLKAHADVTRQTATEGMVLLKNDANALPMKDVKNVAVFGITAYDFIAGGTGSGDVNKAYTVDLMQGITNAGLAVTDDLKNLYYDYKKFQESKDAAEFANTFRWGKPVLPELEVSSRTISNQAKKADIALVCLGRQAGEGADRHIENDFNLTEVERNLLNDVCLYFHQAGKKVIVILNMGNVIETASWKGMPDAILMAWQPGQEGGNSVVDVLTGKANPSGKLTMTFPIAASDIPALANYPNVGISEVRGWRSRGPVKNTDYTLHQEGIYVGYRYFNTNDVAVSYPFGYGLSYTTFAYSKPVVKPGKDGFTATITITNTGKVAGKEAVQLYVSAPDGGLEKPANELKAFAKTRELQPGESQTLTMNVTAYGLSSYNEATQAWETAAGRYTVKFGASVEDIRATAIYTQAKAQSFAGHDVCKPDREL